MLYQKQQSHCNPHPNVKKKPTTAGKKPVDNMVFAVQQFRQFGQNLSIGGTQLI